MTARSLFVEPGQRFGRLVVIDPVVRDHRGQLAALCRCDCGNELTVLRWNLPSGNSKSCGCGKNEGHPSLFVKRGQRFGRLVVIDANAGTRDKTHKRQVTLRCDCGTEYVAAIYSLVDGATKSCGCLRRDRWSGYRRSG